MKKHLVMIVGKYFPDPSPTGKCAEAYIDLLKDQFDISVICLANTNREEFCHHGKIVYPAADSYTIMQHRLAQKKVPGPIQNVAKIPVHMVQCFVHPNVLHSYVKAAYKQLECIHAERSVDVVFSVGAPMAAHVAAQKFHKKHPCVRWVTYTVDSYAGQNKHSRRYKKALAFESTVLGASDYVFLSEEIFDHNMDLYKLFEEKCRVLPYLMPPTPKKIWQESCFDSSKINLVFAGRFYKRIRNPECLLQLAMELDESCVLHLYCQSDCDSVIDDYVQRSRGKILRHNPVSVSQIQQIYAQADVLVNVGNNTAEFKPSKTFEYIASGKPIFNIYYEGQRDAVLEQYPLILQLQREGSLDEKVEALSSFIRDTHRRVVYREEIDRLFYKHSAESILRVLKGGLGE